MRVHWASFVPLAESDGTPRSLLFFFPRSALAERRASESFSYLAVLGSVEPNGWKERRAREQTAASTRNPLLRVKERERESWTKQQRYTKVKGMRQRERATILSHFLPCSSSSFHASRPVNPPRIPAGSHGDAPREFAYKIFWHLLPPPPPPSTESSSISVLLPPKVGNT